MLSNKCHQWCSGKSGGSQWQLLALNWSKSFQYLSSALQLQHFDQTWVSFIGLQMDRWHGEMAMFNLQILLCLGTNSFLVRYPKSSSWSHSCLCDHSLPQIILDWLGSKLESYNFWSFKPYYLWRKPFQLLQGSMNLVKSGLFAFDC